MSPKDLFTIMATFIGLFRVLKLLRKNICKCVHQERLVEQTEENVVVTVLSKLQIKMYISKTGWSVYEFK